MHTLSCSALAFAAALYAVSADACGCHHYRHYYKRQGSPMQSADASPVSNGMPGNPANNDMPGNPINNGMSGNPNSQVGGPIPNIDTAPAPPAESTAAAGNNANPLIGDNMNVPNGGNKEPVGSGISSPSAVQNGPTNEPTGSATQTIPSTIFNDLPGFLGLTFPGQMQQPTSPTSVAPMGETQLPKSFASVVPDMAESQLPTQSTTNSQKSNQSAAMSSNAAAQPGPLAAGILFILAMLF
ncbi:hypothetical protein GGI25_001670 [Coemansia spiralis]|uniref:Secreted protein n=2 Tax=Coemansia TaxID=4863 RepID=A0A9W8GAC4_9FUNG|nr:hypothetical protein BX070DRAFT_257594 [Coemansia spiralis]KAJ1988100.1 hypothetical protein EDC05_005482 [Coemansia umbellata]KAJ2623898.1 hypothetical protein GGI26_001913 [Coemansia sp. RSA 1358]KAJ2679314.1 hypothetical protein GGI25_001670 [Coemansia spiralis]